MSDLSGAVEGTDVDPFADLENVDWSSLSSDDETDFTSNDAESEQVDPPADGDDEGTDEAELTADEDATEDEAPAESDGPVFVVKVDGEEIEVTESELRAGYQRQADYTRKTQEVARERETFERLTTALEQDFDGTVARLRAAIKGDTPDADTHELEALDPLEREVAELKSWRAEREAEARQSQITQELSQLTARFEGISDVEILEYAVAKGGIDLESAAQALAYQRLTATAADKAKAIKAARQSKVDAKRTAPAVAGGAKQPKKAVSSGASSDLSLDEILAEFDL